jgi:hypothetical protein
MQMRGPLSLQTPISYGLCADLRQSLILTASWSWLPHGRMPTEHAALDAGIDTVMYANGYPSCEVV